MKLMKRVVVSLFLLSLVFSTFALDGVVIDVLGKVEKQSGNSWVELKKGDILVPGDIISTGFKSEAVISIGESKITVRALTRMTIEQLYEKNQNHVSSVYLDVGSVSADVKPVENKRVGFTVKTPAVTASVRGTAGIVYAYGKVEGIRGKWGVSAPQPKLVNYARGETTDEVVSSEIIDVELESLLAGPAANNEVYVSAGETAIIIPSVENEIQTPQENKKEEATNLGSSGSVFEAEATNLGSSGSVFEAEAGSQSSVIQLPSTSSIFVEIIIPEISPQPE